MSKAVTPRARARVTIAFVGREETSALYRLLKVAVPQIRGGRMVERGGCVDGILGGVEFCYGRVCDGEGGRNERASGNRCVI